jgi:hypothetical protein
MANKKSKLPFEEWKETINDMSYEELQRCIADPSYYPEYLEYAKSRLAQLESDMAHVYEMFIKTLKKRRIKYELGEDQNVFFIKYERQRFRAELCCEDDFVEIVFIHDIFVDKEDTAKLSRLKEAVNETNKICGVSTFYEVDEDSDCYYVVSTTFINFISQNPNFGMELGISLSSCLSSRYIIKELIKRKRHKRKQSEEA